MLPEVELLVIVSCPVRAPVVAGSNCNCNVRVCVGFRVTGKLPPTIVNPAPVIVAELTVTALVPVEVKVSVCVVGVFSAMLPKFRLVVLTVNCELPAATPVPFRVTEDVLPVVELLLIVI